MRERHVFMRQRGQRNWLGSMLVTGLFAAAVMSGPGTDSNMGRDSLKAAENVSMNGDYLPVRKSSFFPDGVYCVRGNTASVAGPGRRYGKYKP